MTDVRAPDGSIARFPDDMPDAEIEKVMAQVFPPLEQPTAPQTPGGASDFVRGLRMGAIPFGDRVVAAEKTILPQSLGGAPGFDYAGNLAKEQAADEALRASHSVPGNLGQGTGMALQGVVAAPMGVAQDAGLLWRAGAGALQGGVIGGLQGASQSPDLTNLAQTLQNTSHGTAMGGAAGGALPLAAGLAGKIPLQPAVQPEGDEFTRSILNAGNIPGGSVAPSTLKAAHGTITDSMNDIAGRNVLTHDPQLHKDVRAAVEGQTTPSPGVQKMADTILGWKTPETPLPVPPPASTMGEESIGLRQAAEQKRIADEAAQSQQVMPGKDYLSLRSDLTKKAYRLRNSDGDSSAAYGDLRNALDSAFDRSAEPADAVAMRQVRASYGNLQDIATAAGKPSPGANQSVLTPQRMQAVLSSGGDAKNYAMGEGDLAGVTHSAMANAQPIQAHSSLADLLSHHMGASMGRAAAGALGGSHYGPTGMLAGAVGGYALPHIVSGVNIARGAIPRLQSPASPLTSSAARALAARLAAGQ
jgi:hypothetical protein